MRARSSLPLGGAVASLLQFLAGSTLTTSVSMQERKEALPFLSEFVSLKPPESAESVGTIQNKKKWLVNEIAL